LEPDFFELYRLMLRSRLFEEAVIQIWEDGKISGEMHLAIGEEAIAAGIVGQIQKGDALALDHRGTPPLIMRGVDPTLILLEFFGHPDGLCGGMGGHMHMFSRPHLAASSGIVGASAPAAVGFALSARYLRPGSIAVAFFGEGAMNQGMVMESFNLAASRKLPVLFICKDNEWAITTLSSSVTSGSLIERANSFGMDALEIDGSDVMAVWDAAKTAIEKARNGNGPSYLHMHCWRPEGHFLGDPLIQIARHPVKEMKDMAGPLLKSMTKKKGSSVRQRAGSLRSVTSVLGKTIKSQLTKEKDPLEMLRQKIIKDKGRLNIIEKEVKEEIQAAISKAIQMAAGQTGSDTP
jgi:TPP-dependent pyruvate/acetoin dehydrogenase alpha subunit